MGKRDNKYRLKEEIELNDAFFTTKIPVESRNEPLKRGVDSQKKPRN